MSKIKVENGYNLFSPRYKSPFTYKDKEFFNVYQFMLYCQTNNANLKDEAREILNARNNQKLYELDKYNKKGLKGFRDSFKNGKLSENLSEYLKVGMREKYRQNPDLMKELMDINVKDIDFKEGIFNSDINKAFKEGLQKAVEQIKIEQELSLMNDKYDNNTKTKLKSKILKQISNEEVYNVVTRIHDEYDVEEGDLTERLDEFDYYNHHVDYMIDSLNLNEYDIDEDKVKEFMLEIKNNGIEKMPKVVLAEDETIIDGCHRLKALKNLGYKTVEVLKGTNEVIKSEFKKELIDKKLKKYKISNNFGSISIIEGVNNLVCDFLVKEEFRNKGVGTELLKEAMKEYPSLEVNVSSISSLKVFLKCGFVPSKETRSKKYLDTTRYDFKVFQKAPDLLSGQGAAMYTDTIIDFNMELKRAIELFENNQNTLHFKDSRENHQKLKKSKKLK